MAETDFFNRIIKDMGRAKDEIITSYHPKGKQIELHIDDSLDIIYIIDNQLYERILNHQISNYHSQKGANNGL